MRIEQEGSCAKVVELGVVDGTFLKYPVVDERVALGLGCYDCEKRKVVDVKSRIRTRVNALRKGDKLRRLDMNIGEFGDAVFGNARIRDREAQVHFLENRELYLKEFDRGSAHRKPGLCGGSSSDEEHGVRRVLSNGVLGIHIDFSDTGHGKGGSA